MRPLLAVVAVLLAFGARADELSDLLKAGPLVRIETSPDGKLKQSTCIADVDAPIDTVWKTLVDFDSYRFFMPRIKSMEVTREGQETLIAIKLDTPLVSTNYTLRYHPDEATHTMRVAQEKGDLSGSTYLWRVIPLGDGRTRIYYSGLIKNFSSLAEGLDDDQHTITIGINVVSLMATAKAIKGRAELNQRQAAAAAMHSGG